MNDLERVHDTYFRPQRMTNGFDPELLQRLGENLIARDGEMTLQELQEERRRQEEFCETYLADREEWRKVVTRYVRKLYRMKYEQTTYRDAITELLIEEMVESTIRAKISWKSRACSKHRLKKPKAIFGVGTNKSPERLCCESST